MNKMNELITELAEHANYLATEKEFPYDEDWFYLYNRIYAELIVKECVKVCLDQRNPGNLNYKPSEMFADALKLHFGMSDERKN
jgi:hypothetical protein